MPYGVSIAPAVFQSVMDHTLDGQPVACYLDKILVAGRTLAEHYLKLQQVVECLDKVGIRIQRNKYQ